MTKQEVISTFMKYVNQYTDAIDKTAQFNIAYNSMLAQQKHEWMVNGVTMNFEDFLDTICPDEDDPHRTYLIMKYKGVK